MEYLIVYFLLPIPLIIITYFVAREKTKNNMWLVSAFWMCWPLILAAILQQSIVEVKVHNSTRRCAYCGATFSTEDIRGHVLNECDMNPLRIKIADAKAIILSDSYTDKGRIVLLYSLLSEDVQ